MKTPLLLAFVLIGSCLVAHAADPSTTKNAQTAKAADPTANKNAEWYDYVTVIESTDRTTRKLNINAATAAEVTVTIDNKPLNLVIATTDAAKTTPFKDKIVRVQVAAGNRNEIFTLENVRLTSLLGNEFIVGTAVKYGNDRYSGLEVYLNLRLVLTIVAMTPQQAKHFNEMQRPRSGQGASNPQQQGNNPPQGPSNPPQSGPFVPPPGQGPYNPLQGPYNPPQGPSNPPQVYPPQGPSSPPQRGPSILEGGPPLPGQPNTPPPQGYNPRQGQGPYTPPQGYRPQPADASAPEEP
jgi:hypothetical protein